MRNYKEIFEKLVSEILDLTKKDLVTWSITKQGDGNHILATLVGDNGVTYKINYKWEFSSNGWQLSNPHLEVGPPLEVTIYSFTYKIVGELASLISNKYIKGFQPNEEEILKKIQKVSTGISISGQRETKISNIIND